MIQDKLIRAETYKKLKFLEKQYSNLSHQDFPCSGAESIWRLASQIILKLIDRFDSYTIKQIQFINTLFSSLEKLCGFLDDSRIKNVPWSIIPSLEDLFSKIREKTKFVICPLWETNYGIFNRNIIEYFDSKVISVQGLLFDPTTNFDEERSEFLSKYPSSVYFVFYPRTERLSVFHFPLLGHEIGHIFSTDWLAGNFESTLRKHDIKNKVKTHVEGEVPSDVIGPRYRSRAINIRALEIEEIYEKTMSELLSDLVGVFVFGHSALFSSFIFSLKFGLDDFGGVSNGYLSWRFRLHFLQKAMKHMGIVKFPVKYKKANEWLKEIFKIGYVNLKVFDYDKIRHKYIRYIIDAIDNDFDEICKNIISFLGDQQYTTIYSTRYQDTVFKRLENGIIPNCLIDKKLSEAPIDLRNIVCGSWLFLCDINLEDYINFYDVYIGTSLLSLKAIELSHFQKEFQLKAYDSQ